MEESKRPKMTRSCEKVMSSIESTQKGIDCRPLWKKNRKSLVICPFKPKKAMMKTKTMINRGLFKLRKR